MSERIYEQKLAKTNQDHRSSRYPYTGYRAPEMSLCFIRGLGKGGNGTVYLAQECPMKVTNLSPKLYAVKILEKDIHRISRIEKEIKHHDQVACHPNILPLYAACENKTSVFLFCEYIRGGDFAHFLAQYVGYATSRDDSSIKSLFPQILDGVAHMHKLGIYHGDLKPENILCRGENRHVRLLLADFGISTDRQRINHQSGFMRGTRHYLPPECFMFGGYVLPHAIDVWSFGIILYMVCLRSIPWDHASPRSDPCFYSFATDSRRFWSSLPLSCSAKALFKIIWQPNPDRRIDIYAFRGMLQDTMSEFTTHYPKWIARQDSCFQSIFIQVLLWRTAVNTKWRSWWDLQRRGYPKSLRTNRHNNSGQHKNQSRTRQRRIAILSHLFFKSMFLTWSMRSTKLEQNFCSYSTKF